MSDRRDLFAYPFKVLRDIFTNPPFMPEPEFTRFRCPGKALVIPTVNKSRNETW